MPESARALVVDDDDAIRLTVTIQLTDEGYAVLEAADGETALRLVTNEAPDLTMPGMAGREVVRRYRAGPGPHAPISVFTAGRVTPSGIPDVQADAFLAKPFNLEDLLALIAHHLALARRPAPDTSA